QDRALDLAERQLLEHDRAVARHRGDRRWARLLEVSRAPAAPALLAASPRARARQQPLQRTAVQAQDRGRLALVPARAREDAADVHPLVFVQRGPALTGGRVGLTGMRGVGGRGSLLNEIARARND